MMKSKSGARTAKYTGLSHGEVFAVVRRIGIREREEELAKIGAKDMRDDKA